MLDETRLIDLETKIAHQEIAIEELQQTVYDQHMTIERLEKTLKQLNERLNSVIDGGIEIGPGNQKPPHY